MKYVLLIILLSLAACSDRYAAPIVPGASDIGIQQPVFMATNRQELDSGAFGIGRSPDVQLMRMLVSIPNERTPGSISDGGDRPKPGRDFVLVARDDYTSDASFQSSIGKELRRSGSDEVLLYVHGFNNSFSDAAFRMAQLAHDINVPGPVVSFSWPSRGNPLGYQYDADSALYSRDALARLLFSLKGSGAKRIVLVGHSMGGALVTETLRQIELAQPGWSKRSLGGVLLISPDVNVDVFRSQMSVFEKWPQPFVVFSSKKDILLRISGGIRGEDRQLGVLTDVSEISDLPVIFVDVTAFSDGDDARHFVTATSESFIRLVNASNQLDEAFLKGKKNKIGSFFGTRRVVGRAVRVKLEPDPR